MSSCSISAIVIAAGTSSRMGGPNKMLLPFGKKTIVEQTIDQIHAAQPDELIVVTGYQASQLQQTLQHQSVQFVFNAGYEQGMTSSIQCGIQNARGDGYLICLADMPFITSTDYLAIMNAFRKNYNPDSYLICQPRYELQPGNPVLFSSVYRNILLQHPDANGCKEVIRANRDHLIYIDMKTNSVLLDIDHPEQYKDFKP